MTVVPGIGHRVKSRNNPDLRVELVKEFVKKRFPSCKMLDYALAVETVTTSKKDNLILNVDGCVAVCFVDLMRNCGAFSAEEAEDYLAMGVLMGATVIRTIMSDGPMCDAKCTFIEARLTRLFDAALSEF